MAAAVARGLWIAIREGDNGTAASGGLSARSEPKRPPSLTAHFSHGSSKVVRRGYANPTFGALAAPLLIVAAWLHGFAGPVLGVQDLGSSNMYANLRALGGSNHLLLPMNLLQLSGPIVRVESSTSTTLNALYPGGGIS